LKRALASRAIGERVKSILKPLLAGRRPGIEDVARELGTSTRTLQRRIAQDGATFQQLLQQARHELARHYLLHSALELNEMAHLVGYEDAHSFFRAFHEWEQPARRMARPARISPALGAPGMSPRSAASSRLVIPSIVVAACAVGAYGTPLGQAPATASPRPEKGPRMDIKRSGSQPSTQGRAGSQ
jgi:AraC-like DNA-binding protein